MKNKDCEECKHNEWNDKLYSVWHETSKYALEGQRRCEDCEKSSKEERKRRETEADLVSDITKKLELLRVQSGDILMIRVDGKKPGVKEMLDAFKRVFEQAKKTNIWIIAIPTDMVLEKIKKEDMNPAGWYRKEQLIDPKIWEKKKNKPGRKICLDEE